MRVTSPSRFPLAALAIAAGCLVGIAGDGSRGDASPATPRGFEARQVEGWTVFVRLELIKPGNAQGEALLTLLRFQLYQIARGLPANAVTKLRQVRIWVEENEPHNPCMVYHPDAGWLKNNGMDPAKARCVEITNPANFLKWTIEQPWMVLHELSHAYQDQFLKGGPNNPEVKAAFDRAMTAKLYEAVANSNGDKVRAYAATNPMEYFAEASEAFFGTNDFYPYVRAELKGHDPLAFEVLAKLWGDSNRTKR